MRNYTKQNVVLVLRNNSKHFVRKSKLFRTASYFAKLKKIRNCQPYLEGLQIINWIGQRFLKFQQQLCIIIFPSMFSYRLCKKLRSASMLEVHLLVNIQKNDNKDRISGIDNISSKCTPFYNYMLPTVQVLDKKTCLAGICILVCGNPISGN